MNRKSSVETGSQLNRRPALLWAALAFAAGIAAGIYLWRPPVWWLATAIFFSASAGYFARRRARAASTLAWAALFAAGALTIQVRGSGDSGTASTLPFAEGQELELTGHVMGAGEVLPAGFNETRQSLDIETEELASADNTFPVREVVRVGLYARNSGNDAEPAVPAHTFQYGERVRFPTKLYSPRNFRDPGAFDYRGYLSEKGITALASAKTGQVFLLPGFAGNRWELWRDCSRRALLAKIHELWPADDAAIVQAILLGDESFLGHSLRQDFQRTGTYHVLVVSGLKVGILALVAFWLLRRARLNDFAASMITILLAVCYATLTGAGTPVWRATLMLALYLAARLLYRQSSVLNTIGAVALALLLIDPAQLLTASFQLSFLCVLIIAGVGLPLLARTTHPFSRGVRHLASPAYDPHLPPHIAQWRLDLRMIAGSVARFSGKRFTLKVIGLMIHLVLIACDFLLISAVLQAGLALPMAYYFHRATIVALPANVLAVPLTEAIMVASLLAIAFAYVYAPLARIPAWFAALALRLVSGTVRWMGGLRLADARVPTPDWPVILIGAFALILTMILMRRRAWLAGTGLAVLCATSVWICAVAPHPRISVGEMEVTAIDVGQGDSILLVSPQGRTLLVDAGGMPQWMHAELDIGEDVVSPYLWSRAISRLDVVAITHAHADHIGGMPAILENFRPRELWLGVDSPSPELQALLREARGLGIKIVLHHEGDSFDLGGSAIRVLAPALDTARRATRANDDCLVMKVSYAETSVLLEADAERATEQAIAHEEPQADLLKVAHHGSATSTLPELLASVHPRFAVISVGARNVYGHPREEVLKRLGESRVATYRTDLDGAVTFYLDGKKVTPYPADFP